MAPSTPTDTPTRRRSIQHPWRVAIVVGAVLLVLNLGVILLSTADTTQGGRRALPNDVESIAPERGELTGVVDTVSVDLRDDMTGVLVIDGVEIPEDQLERVVGLQVVSFRPGPGREIPRFRAGDNTVVVEYWRGRLQDRPANPYTFGWTFRASA